MRILLSRNPIFDAQGRTAGYDVLSHVTANGDSPERILTDALVGVGLPRLAESYPAFVPITHEMTWSDALLGLEPRQLFLQLPMDQPVAAETMAGCRALVANGHRLVLQNVSDLVEAGPLLDMASIIRFDLRARTGDELERLTYALLSRRVALLADNVEDKEQLERSMRLGFTLFQGPLFSRPMRVERADLPVEHLRLFKLMRLVNDPLVGDAQLEDEFRRNPAFTYKLLRIVNSAATGASVHSIAHAIRLLGRASLYRWLCLLLLSAIARREEQSPQMVLALVRARMCELVCDVVPQPPSAGAMFLAGLFSAMLPLFDMTPAELADQLSLSAPVREALQCDETPIGTALAAVVHYERGQWDELRRRAQQLRTSENAFTQAYLDAVRWAAEVRAAA